MGFWDEIGFNTARIKEIVGVLEQEDGQLARNLYLDVGEKPLGESGYVNVRVEGLHSPDKRYFSQEYLPLLQGSVSVATPGGTKAQAFIVGASQPLAVDLHELVIGPKEVLSWTQFGIGPVSLTAAFTRIINKDLVSESLTLLGSLADLIPLLKATTAMVVPLIENAKGVLNKILDYVDDRADLYGTYDVSELDQKRSGIVVWVVSPADGSNLPTVQWSEGRLVTEDGQPYLKTAWVAFSINLRESHPDALQLPEVQAAYRLAMNAMNGKTTQAEAKAAVNGVRSSIRATLDTGDLGLTIPDRERALKWINDSITAHLRDLAAEDETPVADGTADRFAAGAEIRVARANAANAASFAPEDDTPVADRSAARFAPARQRRNRNELPQQFTKPIDLADYDRLSALPEY